MAPLRMWQAVPKFLSMVLLLRLGGTMRRRYIRVILTHLLMLLIQMLVRQVKVHTQSLLAEAV